MKSCGNGIHRRWLATALVAAIVASASMSPRVASSQEERPGQAKRGANASGDPRGDRARPGSTDGAEPKDDDDEPKDDDGDGPDDAGADDPGPPADADRDALDRWLADRVDALIAERPALAAARIGIAVRDLGAGRTVYERDADGRYNVASNTKLVTATAALALLGPDFRFRTDVYAESIDETGAIPGDLYIRGRGDPSIGRRELADIAREVALAGVKRVRGRVVLDDEYFDDAFTPPHFDEQPKEQASFRAPVAALSVSFSTYAAIVRPARSGVGPAEVLLDPDADYIQLEKAEVVTQPTGRARVRVRHRIENDRVLVTVTGQIPATSGPRRFRRRAPDPARHFGAAFVAALAEAGIAVRERDTRRGPVPDDAVAIARYESEPLAILVHGMGKYSNNFVAEVLLKTIGAERAARGERPATWADGIAAVEAFLEGDIGWTRGAFRYGNGSGLFDASEIAPAQIVALLAHAHRDMRYGPELVASLAIAGVDGTLRRRLAKSPAAGLVRAKTGTLAAVTALSGYAGARGDRPLAFAVLVDDIPIGRGRGAARAARAARRDARRLQDAIATALVQYAAASP